MEFIRRNKSLILIFLLGAVLRFYKLGEVPLGVTNDEINYIYNAYSIAHTGRNVFSQIYPLFTWVAVPFMPGAMYSMVPVFWIIPLSAFSGRFLSALFGSIDILLLYVLIFKLFKNRPLALLSALFLAISSWHLHFSRTAYETNISLFYYLLGILIFIVEIGKKRLPLFSSLLFLIAFYSYRGMSVIAFPLFFIIFFYSKYALKALPRQLWFFLGTIFVIAGVFLFTLSKFGPIYSGEATYTFDSAKLSQSVDKMAREAQGPLFLKRIFINKPFTVISYLRENYIKSYSPEFLFLYSDQSQIYSIWSRGRLYFIDIIFVILGFPFLYKLNKKAALFITSIFLIGGLPGGFSGAPYSARNFFLSIIFPVLTAGGVLFLINQFKAKILKYFLIFLISLSYLYVFSGYLFDYYFRYAPQRAENWDKSLKDLSFYLNKNKDSFAEIRVGDASLVDILQYSFYSKIKPSKAQDIVINKIKYQNNFSYKAGNITFYPSCPPFSGEKNVLLIAKDECFKKLNPFSFIKDYFGNNIWIIWKS